MHGKFEDMSGWVMKEHGVPESRLTVLYRIPNIKGKVYWHCLCECGTEKDIRGDQIKSGVAKSCGCLQREIARHNCRITGLNNKNKEMSTRKDIAGQKFGYLTAIKIDHIGNGTIYWRCECDCGRFVVVPTSHLTTGHTKSCGCKANELISQSLLKDFHNQKIGKLLVQDFAGIKNHSGWWNCLCDCGNNCVVSSTYLTDSKYPNCGCVRSLGEIKVKSVLDSMNIPYKREYTFEDLRDKHKLRFDFAIFQNNKLYCLIEYQGVQHYAPRGSWETPIEHDQMKENYCLQNNIPLVIIPYTDYNKINKEYIEEKIKLCKGTLTE